MEIKKRHADNRPNVRLVAVGATTAPRLMKWAAMVKKKLQQD